MIKVNDHALMADAMSILSELRDQLLLNEIQLLGNIKPGASNIQFNCPSHSDGQERKPSCGMSTVDKTEDNKTTPAGTVHCFTCGYTATLPEFVSYCFGHDDNGSFGTKWLIRNFLTLAIEDRKEIDLDLSRKRRNRKPKYISDDILDTYRVYHDYMFQRKLDEDLIDMFDVGYDPKFELEDRNGKITRIPSLTFPVRDRTGGTLFIGRRAVSQKLFHYPADAVKPVYGVYELMTYAPDANEVVICESILNAITCWKYGIPGLALLGLGTAGQYKQLLTLPPRKYILGLDPDEAGQKASDRFRAALADKKLITQFKIPKGKDINDLSESEFKGLKEIF